MGIDIKEKEILYNPNHDKLLGTSIPDKITEIRKNGKSIYSIFRRVKNKDGNKKGDGNPAIFALKGLNGFFIENSEKKKFLPSFVRILKKILDTKNIDLIIIIPSSHSIADELGLIVSKMLGGVKVEKEFFKKSTNFDISRMSLHHVKSKDMHAVKRICKRIGKMPKDEDFSMKEINNRYRKYFSPLKYNSHSNEIFIASRVLIVDDLYASGTSMKNAMDIIEKLNSKILIEGLCLFSHLRP